ncbi:MAG: hypothetical protein Q8P22_10045 [Chloroflexota bacterium]|nr:hypothetical protein [Chloroflexota bacterium]
MQLPKPLEQYDTVRTWFDDFKSQWGENPDDVSARLDILRHFCQFVGKDPDTIIRECLREVEGQTKISIKGRRFYDEKIREFQASVEGDARHKARWGNTIRSFLIHNGIFLQSGVQLC